MMRGIFRTRHNTFNVMKVLKTSILILAAAIIVLLAAATIVEGVKGTAFAHENIYGTVGFLALWTAFGVAGTVYILKKKLYGRVAVFMIHLSFVVIMLGALTSWLTAESGTLHVRQGEVANMMKTDDGKNITLDFKVRLKNFHVEYYPGTDAPMDYVTEIDAGGETVDISMNNIGGYRGYRFTQAGYDSDMNGSILGIYHDTWGIGITYLGYAMLFVSLIVSLVCNRTRMSHFYHKAMQGIGAKAVLLMMLVCFPFAAGVKAQERINIDKGVADDFGKICVLYNSRITPVNTVAVNFVTKLCGKASWDGMSANEVFAGWVFDVPYWETVKMIEIKDSKVREILGISGKWASFADFWNEYNEYKLQKPLDEAYKRGDEKLQKQLRGADEKFNVVRMLYSGEMLKIFPYKEKNGGYKWFAPGEPLVGTTFDDKEMVFVRKSMDYLAESVITGDKQRADDILHKIYNYQHVRGKEIMPSSFLINAEVFYNGVNALRFPIMVYLALSLLLAILSTMAFARKYGKSLGRTSLALSAVMLVHITLLLVLRWMVSGHTPMSNGFETMQFMAWATLVLSLVMRRKFDPIRTFGPLLASFALLVAVITDSNPQVTQLMPVLQSPLLSVHVMVIMFSYALFGLMALVSIQGITAHCRKEAADEERLAALSQMLLYPAVALLAIGIFIGAVWANVSWGRYWSWDSKETWALITMLVYSAPLHSGIKWLGRPLHIHIYHLLAFLSVLMTYFGVNYFLCGLHSYA